MTKKNKESKNGNHQELIDRLENKNIIIYKNKATEQANKLVPLAHQFIKNITNIVSIEDYPGYPNEFIAMLIMTQAYAAANLLIILSDMFPNIPLNILSKNFKKSLESSITLQLQNHGAP